MISVFKKIFKMIMIVYEMIMFMIVTNDYVFQQTQFASTIHLKEYLI